MVKGDEEKPARVFHQCLLSLHLKLEPVTLPFNCCSTTIVKFSCFSLTSISILTFFTITLFLCPSNVGPPPKDVLGLCALFSIFTPCDVSKGICLLSFHYLCIHMYVDRKTYERNSSLGQNHVVCNWKTK